MINNFTTYIDENGNSYATSYFDASGTLFIALHNSPSPPPETSFPAVTFGPNYDDFNAQFGGMGGASFPLPNFGGFPPSGNGSVGHFIADAVLDAGLLKQSWYELGHPDFSSWAGVGTFVVAGIGIVTGTIDAGANLVLPVKSGIKSGLKGVAELFVKDAAKEGGRLGSRATREQVSGVAGKLEQKGWEITGGGGKLPEEYIPGPGGARKGSSYPDITATKNGETLRVNTIDTRANGLTPTTREANSAARIRSQKPDDTLILVPK
jgi:hypothetical protein